MTRTVGSNGPATAQAIQRAGLQLIYEHGYEGMNLRQLAAAVGLQPASLYHHIRTKQDLLFGLIEAHMQSLLAQTDAALPDPSAGAAARLRAFVAHHVTYHVERQREVFIGSSELRSLEPANRRAIVALRRAYEARLVAILEAGVAEGVLAVADLQTSAYAILALLTGICTWYKPDGRLSVAELVAVHTALVLEGCGLATGACSRPPVRSTPAAPHAERARSQGPTGRDRAL